MRYILFNENEHNPDSNTSIGKWISDRFILKIILKLYEVKLEYK